MLQPGGPEFGSSCTIRSVANSLREIADRGRSASPDCTIAPRVEKVREYGPDINIPFLTKGFHKYILNLRKDSEDTYLIRTGSSYTWFVRTKSEGWKLYRYGDKPIK